MDEPLMFSPTVNRSCFNVVTRDDALLESTENILLGLDTDDPGVDLNPADATVTIFVRSTSDDREYTPLKYT